MDSDVSKPGKPAVGLFVTCLVDLMRPSVGFAAIQLLEAAGCTVFVPEAQTCCGQPAYNSGDNADTMDIARNVIRAFENVDYLVAPSGSCAGMIKHHYPELFSDDPQWRDRALALSAKSHELTSFLTDVRKYEGAEVHFPVRATYHDSCSGLRELGVKAQPRLLLDKVSDLTLIEGSEAETCCGFGGLFCVKYPDISENMVDEKIENIEETGADLVLGGDMGCLMNISGRLSRKNKIIQVRHVAEVLAGMTDGAPICAGESKEG